MIFKGWKKKVKEFFIEECPRFLLYTNAFARVELETIKEELTKEELEALLYDVLQEGMYFVQRRKSHKFEQYLCQTGGFEIVVSNYKSYIDVFVRYEGQYYCSFSYQKVLQRFYKVESPYFKLFPDTNSSFYRLMIKIVTIDWDKAEKEKVILDDRTERIDNEGKEHEVVNDVDQAMTKVLVEVKEALLDDGYLNREDKYYLKRIKNEIVPSLRMSYESLNEDRKLFFKDEIVGQLYHVRQRIAEIKKRIENQKEFELKKNYTLSKDTMENNCFMVV